MPTHPNRLVPFLARCVGAKSQRWSFDIQKKEVHPQNEYGWCLDSDFDKAVRRPLTVFRCGKTFSKKAASGHQQASTNEHCRYCKLIPIFDVFPRSGLCVIIAVGVVLPEQRDN